MRICVIGAGALGGTYGGRLAHAGYTVGLIDTWAAHVEAINRKGLRVDGVPGDLQVRVPAFSGPEDVAGVDVAIVTTDAASTPAAARTAAEVLDGKGFALSIQNGIGNVEALTDALGADRVLGGSTMCSFRNNGPGYVTQTHAGPTTVGELDGSDSERVRKLAEMLTRAGFETNVVPDIVTVIWSKFIINVGINALCAATRLRLGELARCPATDAFQDRILDEAFAVVRAKGLTIDEAEMRATIKRHCRTKFSQPSMLQHIEAGRTTEIDALNGALVREAAALGLAAPYNDALTMLVKGCEAFHRRRVHEPDVDYAALEREAQAEAGG